MIRETCPICGCAEKMQIYRVENAPVVLNRLADTKAEAQATPTGILDFVGCNRCGFLWNRSFDAAKVPYDEHYENDQTHSTAFRSHIDAMAARVHQAVATEKAANIVEVGCGQAVFLRILAERSGANLHQMVGFDPSFRSDHLLGTANIRVHREYFDGQSVAKLELTPSVVISRHTIEHVDDPVAFLKAIRSGIGDTSARLFIETPDVSWVLERGEIEDFFYEHCSLFNPYSMELALKVAGFTPVAITGVFDGQYMWAEAVAGSEEVASPASSVEFPDIMAGRDAFIREWKSLIATGAPAVVWGAGAKGVSFCALVDEEAQHIAAVVDVNPAKQGKFMPLTGHQVLAPNALKTIRPKTVVVMNPNYKSEIAAMLTGMGLAPEIRVLGPLNRDSANA